MGLLRIRWNASAHLLDILEDRDFLARRNRIDRFRCGRSARLSAEVAAAGVVWLHQFLWSVLQRGTKASNLFPLSGEATLRRNGRLYRGALRRTERRDQADFQQMKNCRHCWSPMTWRSPAVAV